MHLVGSTEMQLKTRENRRPSITQCASWCLARDRMQ